ncbi:major facilitator superfamily domain-containing protein [Colletotrichum navitas]|uniref:Major facilitator superfamily domain-containing protein n=1 Tax=Colletotrichum navitas TaxID=681940 RepID=A0AAD8Q1U1_9PEZI|nr:major facilitator superfamily domain-containing protein [Colletotrichum navitas]KAK1593294.1 major facilitator superfamily domain-containing protein [Colletotrichum navitas]
MADLSLNKPGKGVASSISSTRSGVFRHALLKTSSGRPMMIERDLPVPPILSRQASNNLLKGEQKEIVGYENNLKIAIPSRKHPHSQMQGSSPQFGSTQLMDSTPNTDPSFQREPVCVDPLIHPDQSHIKVHHRGLLKGADFCDTGVPGQPVAQQPDELVCSSSPSPVSSEAEVIQATVRRAMTGDDLCLSTVNITLPRHGGHSHAIKVRPAFNLPTFHYPIVDQEPQYPLATSKVRPFDPAKEHLLSDNSTVEAPVLNNTDEGPANIPVSKVRPFTQEPPQLNRHAGHQSVSKVRAFSDESKTNTEKDREKYFAIGSDKSANDEPAKVDEAQSPTTPRSRESTIDYKRTAQWLRDLVKNSNAHTTQLTKRPSKTTRPSYAALRDSLWDDPSPPKISRQTTLPPSDVEPGIFQSTFGELERLLNEALSLASRVADHEEARAPNLEQSPCYTSNGVVSPAIPFDETPQFSDIDLNESKAPNQQPQRRAATFPNTARPTVHGVDELYRNISLTPQTTELENILGRNTKAHQVTRKIQRRRKSRSRQAGPIPERISSRKKSKSLMKKKRTISNPKGRPLPRDSDVSSMDGSSESSLIDYSNQFQTQNESNGPARPRASTKRVPFISRNTGEDALPERDMAGRPIHNSRGISLRGKSHVSLRGVQAFSLPKSKRRQQIARDWSPVRKRAIAAVACISTALIGLIIGIYAGLVPSLQYYILDTSHSIINGNVGCFLGMAIPTFFCWPLPLVHGRKPYITSGLVLSMPLLFPQALARMVLLTTRGFMGVCLGFASMNFHSILTDLFGASLMSSNPHQEVVDDFDVRRHGGGMGVWLGIWTWCYIASLGFGFLIGAAVIDQLQPAWGFYISIILVAVVLLLNTLCPEVRRSAFRRSVVEVRTGADITRRVARGEIMMHRVKTGPRWWGQELYHGVALCFEMLRQPGFAIIAVYSGWIYAQVVLVIVLLGSLSSRFYRMRSPYVGLMVAAMAFGAVIAIPFQKASYFSRARHTQVNTSRLTFDKQITWTSHLLRRSVFAIGLPLAGLVYTLVSTGPPMHPSAPAIVAAAIGFLSCLAISECNGLIMETFDTSDLQPGMMGRLPGNSDVARRKKNYSAYPRVTAGFAVCHTLGFIFAAGATALGGMAQRNLGQRAATGVVAGILFFLTVMLLLALARFKEVVIIPESKAEEMDKWTAARRQSIRRRDSLPVGTVDDKDVIAEEEPWRPFIVGNPTSKTRRVNVLELGSMSRFTEIRKRNKLIDANQHLNRAALDAGLDALDDQISDIVSDIVSDAKDLVGRNSQPSQRTSRSRRNHRSATSEESGHSSIEMNSMDDRLSLNGHRQRAPPDIYNKRECLRGQTVKEE